MGRMADRSVAAELGFLWRESGGELTWSVRAPDDGVAVTHEPGDRVVPSEPTAGTRQPTPCRRRARASPTSPALRRQGTLTRTLAIQTHTAYHIYMSSKTTVNFDDETEAALAELVQVDGTKTLAIKRALQAEVKRRRRSKALLDLIESWEADEAPIDRAHLDWADEVLDRQGVSR